MAAARESDRCTHLDQIKLRELPASVDGCEECLRDGDKWLHLRTCLTWKGRSAAGRLSRQRDG